MRSPSRTSFVLCFTLCALLSVLPGLSKDAEASAFSRLDLATLDARADEIFVGTVERVSSRFVSAERRGIVTDVTLRCDRQVLGVRAGGRLVVRHLGGEVEGRGQRVFGEASFVVGEQVLLFASKRSGAYWPVGMAQGALHVRRDDAGLPRVRTDLGGADLGVGSAPPLDGRPLDDVVAELVLSQGRK